MATLIQSTELDVACVFPQCLDNQFVSFSDFERIIRDGLSYKHPQIAESRYAHTSMEFNRALVYGQQVCVNRASLPNCKPLYDLYLPSVTADGSEVPNPRYQIDEVGELVDSRAVVPYLFSGSSLEGDGRFSRDPEGQRAMEHLLAKHSGRIRFLTLGADAATVKKNAAKIALEFETRADRLSGVAEDPDLFPSMLAEVLPSAGLVESVEAASELRTLAYRVYEIVAEKKSTRRKSPDTNLGMITREEVYQDLFVCKCTCADPDKCTCVPNGRFVLGRVEVGVGAHFCLKTLIDLIYAANIPDMLHRYVMTPWQLPCRNALQDNGPAELEHAATIDDVARETFAHSQRFHAEASKAMYLPMLDQLTLKDICTIRELPAWKVFMAKQEQLLRDPLGGARVFADFQEAFADLQAAISSYSTKKRFEGQAGKRYVSFVSAMFQIGKHAVRFGVRHWVKGPEVVFLDMVIDYVVKQAERVAVGPARLLFEVFDAETQEVDAARSWSVEWMRKQVSWNRDDLLGLLRDERGRAAQQQLMVDTGEKPADVSGG